MRTRFTIKLLPPNQVPPFDLLLTADPHRSKVETYLAAGHCFVMVMENKVVGVIVLQKIDRHTYEIMNVAVAESHQGQGLGKALILFAVEQAKSRGATSLTIGTGNSSLAQLALYQKCGFRMIDIEKDYFLVNYTQPIFENGIQCKDMVRLQLKLRESDRGFATATKNENKESKTVVLDSLKPIFRGVEIPNTYTIYVENNARQEDRNIILQGLMIFNRRYAGDDNYQPLNIFLRDPDNAIVGGLLGKTYWGWLHVNILWLADDVRGQGHGAAILETAEQEAIRRGCRHAHLDTLSFQALPFYQNRGYIIFGQLDDLPPGHTRYFLKKDLQL